MKKMFYLTFIILSLLVISCGDGMDVLFNSNNKRGYIDFIRIGGSNHDTGSVMVTDSMNNLIVLGRINGDADLNGDMIIDAAPPENSTNFGSSDVFITKVKPDGNILWSKRIGGTGNDSFRTIMTDSFNNIYLFGMIVDDADLNGNGITGEAGIDGESGAGYASADFFILKLDAAGNYLWSKRMGGASPDYPGNMEFDSSGNIILSGTMTNQADLDGDGILESAGFGGYDIYISKFNPTGTCLWTKRLGGGNNDSGSRVRIDSGDNIIVTGYVNADVDLNGNGTPGEVAVEGEDGAPLGDSQDVYTLKLDADGNYIWSKRFGGASTEYGRNVEVDGADNILLTGTVMGNADFDGNGTTGEAGVSGEVAAGFGSTDVYVIKLTSNGLYSWSKRIGGPNQDNTYNDNVVYSGSNVVITGVVNGNADFDGDGVIGELAVAGENSAGYGLNDIFVVSFDLTTGNYVWSKRLGSAFDDMINSAVSWNNNIFISGYIRGDADLDGNGISGEIGVDGESSAGYLLKDGFFSRFDSAGVLLVSKRLGGTADDNAYYTIVNSANKIIVTGGVAGNADLNGDGIVDVDYPEDSTGYGNSDIFISKFNLDGSF